jgi:hypothetical protein
LVERFLRFLLINYYEYISDNVEELLFKEMFFNDNNEIIMSKYLSIKTLYSADRLLASDVFIYGLQYRNKVQFDNDILENFYLDYVKSVKLDKIKNKISNYHL